MQTEHVVQIYETDASLIETMDRFIGESLRAGNAAVIFATPPHREQFERCLAAGGFDVDGARDSGQYVAFDAEATLADLVVDGLPDPDRFTTVVNSTVERLSARWGHVSAFGEMVGLLAAAGNHDGAVRLERMWESCQRRAPFPLLCSYQVDQLAAGAPPDIAERVCAAHSRVVPAESYLSLPDADAQLRMVALLQLKVRRFDGEIDQRERATKALGEEAKIISRREREVAGLIADGMTNAQIAERLVIAEGTVANHLQHIYRKLGLKSRTQIAMWAVKHGIYRSEDEGDL